MLDRFFTVLPITSSFLVRFRPVNYRIEALDVLYPMVRGWSAKSSFWSSQRLGQSCLNLVKLLHTPGNVLRAPSWGSFEYGEPLLGQPGLVRVVSFCMPTPEKIPRVKIGLWQERSFISPKKYIFGPNFFTKLPPQLFSQPKTYGAFRRKTVTDKNFAPFFLERPRNGFSEKHVFDLNFFTKTYLSYFRGQMDYMVRLEAKLFGSEVSFLRKNTFLVRILLQNRHLT